jgi:hypothetical protein
MTDSGGLSWEAQEVFQNFKSFNRLPGIGIPLIQLNMKVGSAKTVKKGIPELKSAGFITDTALGEPTLTDKGYKTLFGPSLFQISELHLLNPIDRSGVMSFDIRMKRLKRMNIALKRRNAINARR